ncbi:MAG: hypothetical protein ACD_32C00113G0009 [uncultured bacterium]|uniref:Tetratricopeptide TPR_2 repeat protein n=1 Tax=Candidatus Daviesbacteria bacterium GW2011_GWC2_40_12 TaxID=1618431 RepID=A0A0G0TXG6_9BACT|nr:MAG: hypothetical protein ACD_32C00113G0009 [uncultured bacterium]KKR17248.1 MAG: Tetratricopeptide TPR_2 repeat protein [Candidatus Daviesbacteria bacterium GW2011_GWA2_39_33]KKR42647.1 MAG: Tetratricopeptide TPR_2 repeat protein [Candidatus Daviesbacteria bacterium GW2011_GWC2_40_12]OGE21322.1 MAG: hypothetical protein A2778_04100 [Candidatus Daviesbacteria bacterium RIFCSPHIGHO2_01_FULL_40_24]OGE30160.1 MAG: hypothetical protein A3C29_02020 [Candidatus Daviesbacteria bacterium RIFCSPHIGHO
MDPKKNLRIFAKNILYKINKNPVSKALYDYEIQKRSGMPFTSILQLSRHIQMFSPFTCELQPVNDWYGHATILKKFLGLPKNYQFKFIIEHGTFLSEQVADIELESNLPSFVTYSKYREGILKKYRPHTYAIGPLIHYASHYLTQDQLKREKRRLGKTILFFPSHSLIGLTNEYDMEWSYKKIKSIAKGFDTIRVCIYWRDVLLGRHKFYLDKGIECVTAGHILDPNFLPRVKSIIQTADLTVSNDASSPLSYCIYMNKPHIIFYQRPEMHGKIYFKKVMSDYWKSDPYNEIVKEFSKIKFKITDKQCRLINYYCGTENVKSKAELKKIVQETEQFYKKTKTGNI